MGLGLLMLFLEVSVPSHGLLAVGGLICFVLGAGALYTTPGPEGPNAAVAWPLIGVMAGLGVLFAFVVVKAAVSSRRMRPANVSPGLVVQRSGHHRPDRRGSTRARSHRFDPGRRGGLECPDARRSDSRGRSRPGRGPGRADAPGRVDERRALHRRPCTGRRGLTRCASSRPGRRPTIARGPDGRLKEATWISHSGSSSGSSSSSCSCC